MNWKKSVRTPVGVAATLGLVVGVSATTAGAGASATATCSQLAKAQIQPLLIHHVTKLTVKPVPGVLYFSSAKQVGQTCVFADTESTAALTVVVIGGAAAARAYQSDLHSLGPALASVPMVSGGKAVRERADSRGAVGSAEVSSIKGSTYCAVIPQTDEIPSVAKLEQAAGYTADIGDKAYANIAAAIGTVCNRIYGSGSTNPSPALAALKKIKPKKTSGGGLPVPKLPPAP
jgi:hypothetical protein